jgi:hypothetical protein
MEGSGLTLPGLFLEWVGSPGLILDHPTTRSGKMAGEPTDVVAIMAAIIFAGRTGESAQAPKEKEYGLIAKAAWDLHAAVVASDVVRSNRAGFQQS